MLYRGLAHLQATEFLYETSLFPERVYTFKHALAHEAAYSSLLQERRRALHAWIVEALESLGGERLADQVERLAYHALRGEVWDKALMYFRQSGAKAVAQSAYRKAVSFFEQALSALQHLPESHDRLEQGIDLRLYLRAALQPLRPRTSTRPSRIFKQLTCRTPPHGPFDQLIHYFIHGEGCLPCVWVDNCANAFVSIDARGNVAQYNSWVTSYPEYAFGNIFACDNWSDVLRTSQAR